LFVYIFIIFYGINFILLDMGGDGGSIPKRDDLVRTRTKPEQANRNAELLAKWKHCTITQQPLEPPIVACELGRLYNKEAVLEFLLDRSKLECAAKFCHIRGLKDVKELKLTVNPAFSTVATKSRRDRAECQYICPVSGLEMNGRYRFCYFLGCGCVFSDRALKEIKDSTCVNCGKSYVEDDIIMINGTDEEIADLHSRMEQRRLLAKSKASKKRKAESSATVESTTASASTDSAAAAEPSVSAPSDVAPTAAVVTASVTKAAKLSAAGTSSNGGATASKPAAGATSGKEHKPKTIQDDPKASEVFKSLFNTHKTAKMQTKAHWVTYNPQYF
jgi:hypothetical protein